MTEYEFELVLEAIIVCGLVLLSLVYCISCTRWANEMIRKCRAVMRWVEDQRASEGEQSWERVAREPARRDGPYDEDGGGAE